MGNEIFAVFESGGSDEPLMGIYSDRESAEAAIPATGSNCFVVTMILNQKTHEYIDDHNAHWMTASIGSDTEQ